MAEEIRIPSIWSLFWASTILLLLCQEVRLQGQSGTEVKVTDSASKEKPNKQLEQQVAAAKAAKDEKSIQKLMRANVSNAKVASASFVTQTILTFITVFFIGCAVILGVYAWKKYSQSSMR